MRHLILLSSLLILTACANASVLAPNIGQDEISAEQAQQEQYAKQAGKKEYTPVTLTAQESTTLNKVIPRVQQAGQKVCSQMSNGMACNYAISLVTTPPEKAAVPNAYADGKAIFVHSGLVRLLQGEEDLAFVLSHEYAHNVLEHVNKNQLNAILGMAAGTLADQVLASQGYSTGGQLGKLGTEMGVLSYSSAYEREADYVGLYIARNAGYDVTRGSDVWRKMAANNPDSIYLASTHPTSAERYVAMQKIIAEIKAKEQAGQPLLPNPAER